MKRRGGTLNAYYWVKGANLTKLRAIWFPEYGILEKAECGGSKKTSGFQMLRKREGWAGTAQKIAGQWDYSLYYIGKYVSLYIYQNP